ncbi:hypothetical protein [Antribacter gilvus]|uniref:hypothetical protein n=1 Tax=Antribacter gilvus TaxID=2304675 RepID=UPI000F7A5170|nr:hypothetical protein [Antribacter gilvus]
MTNRYLVKLWSGTQTVEGYISVVSGALVVRASVYAPPHLIIAAGSWTRAELITEEGEGR